MSGRADPMVIRSIAHCQPFTLHRSRGRTCGRGHRASQARQAQPASPEEPGRRKAAVIVLSTSNCQTCRCVTLRSKPSRCRSPRDWGGWSSETREYEVPALHDQVSVRLRVRATVAGESAFGDSRWESRTRPCGFWTSIHFR